MRALVRKSNPSSEFMTPEGCHIIEAWNDPCDPDVSIARARVAPGVTTQPHHLRGIVERYLIIQGEGSVRIGDSDPQGVAPGDVVIIPSGVRQQITNTGAGDLIFYCVCSPRFSQDAYEVCS